MIRYTNSKACLIMEMFLAFSLSSSVWAEPPGKIPSMKVAPQLKTKPKAADYLYTVKTRERASKQGKVKVGNLTWQCKDSHCTVTGPWATPGVSACNALAKQVGQINSYGHAKKKLNAAQLRQCNAGVSAVASKAAPKLQAKTKAGIVPKADKSMPKPPGGGKAVSKVSPQPKSQGFAPQAKMPPVPVPGPSDLFQKKAPSGVSPKSGSRMSIGKPGKSLSSMVKTPKAAQEGLEPKSKMDILSATGKGGFVPAQKTSSQKDDRAASPGIPSARGVAPSTLFAPKTVNLDSGLTMTGMRFTQQSITTPELTMTGMRIRTNKTRTISTAVNIVTSTLTMTGMRFTEKTVNTPALTMTGTH